MIYNEIKGDLFKVSDDYTLVQCISSCCKMAQGIAVEFVKRNPNMRKELQAQYPRVGEVLLYEGGHHNVLNLITKEYYYNKPTRESFNRTIRELKLQCLAHQVHKIAMPLIGSGLDKLSWDVSSKYIQEAFADTDIEILVVKL